MPIDADDLNSEMVAAERAFEEGGQRREAGLDVDDVGLVQLRKGVRCTYPHPGFGQYEPEDVLDRRVLVLGKVVENFVGPVDVERPVTCILSRWHGRYVQLLEQSRRSGVDDLHPPIRECSNEFTTFIEG